MSDKAGGLFYPKTESSQPHEQELGSAFLQGSFQNDQAEVGQFTGMVLVPPLVMLSLVVCVRLCEVQVLLRLLFWEENDHSSWHPHW